MKGKKVLLSIVLIAIAIILAITTKTYAADTIRLNAVKIREGKNTKNSTETTTTRYSYEINSKPVLKIVDETSGTANYDSAIYCVKAGVGFGSNNQTIVSTLYNLHRDMATQSADVKTALNMSDANYNSVMWLLDNFYLPKQTPIRDRQAVRNALLNNAFANEFAGTNSIVDNYFEDWTVDELYITDDDIEVVQQWALWYFTNSNDNTFHVNSLPDIRISKTGTGTHTSLGDEGPELTDWADPTNEGYVRYLEAKVLYNYFITKASTNTNYNKVTTQITLNPNLTATAKSKKIVNTTYVIAGPFELQKTGNTEYTFTGKVLDGENKEITYTISDANGNAISGVRTLAEAVGKGQFYVKVEKSNSSVIALDMSYTTSNRTFTYWTVAGSTVDQPVVIIDYVSTPIPLKVTVNIPKFDLALRKYITGVKRSGNPVTIEELNGRVPNVNKERLNNPDTTAEYKHRKDPVLVQTGDIVEYTITVYNEGAVDGRATKIVDYLPEGLVFDSAISANYNFQPSEDGRTILITPKTVVNLPAYNGTLLAATDIKFNCKVVKREDKTQESTILTNIAEITEAYDVNGNQIINVGDDRDSEPNNLRKPTDANLPGYKGNENNKADLTDKNYHYKGQQDDDDFEKLKVITPEFDLALRKYITHIDGTEVAVSREPIVDTTPLKNGETTAKYAHLKAPLTVNVGSVIRYTIRVYNEAEVDGYVTIIEDYLPEELELVPAEESTINAKYGWTGEGRIVTTSYLNGKTLTGYKGGDTLDSKFVEIECRVKEGADSGKVLTNIAQINGYSNTDRDSRPSDVNKPSDSNLPGYKGNESNKTDLTDKNYHYKGQQDDDDFEKVKIYVPGYDFALRKYITKVNGTEVAVSREPIVDTTPLKTKKDTTAKYTHTKEPVIVNVGDKVVYTIRIYNEGEGDGEVTIIEDYLPEELEMVPLEDSTINTKYGWQANGRIITTEYLRGTNVKGYNGGDTLDSKFVEIECFVKSTAQPGKILTNIAQINGDTIEDRDSQPSNVKKPSDENLPSYSEHQQDDDDYEKVKVYKPLYDLALRKFIVEINGVKPEVSRVPQVDVSPLKDNSDETTTAKYTHPKNPLLVKTGDIVVYTIRVYNEGETDAYAEEIKDNIPEGLEFVIDNEINIEYRWKLAADTKSVSTDYLSKARDIKNVLKAFDSSTMETLDYKDVKIAFKVVEPNTSTRVLTNIAEIKNDDGNDIDSTPDNNVSTEDDIDVEHVKLKYFDLALRKFIVKVEDKDGENLPVETDTTKDVSREPKVEIGEDGKIKYVHPKDPVIVANSDVVIYTLRVYNEGRIDGFAEEIKDDVPAGLELLPDHEINKQYGWVMYDEDGKVTEDPTAAKTIRTIYLSSANSADNIIKGFDREKMTTPEYKDVQVAFKVIEKNANTDRIIINTAEISKDSDDDIDSTPDNNVLTEDDIDKEYVKLKYFDLALYKWVSKQIVTRNGSTTVYETKYNETTAQPPAKLEIKESEIKSILVKYEYVIKIVNEGQIAGYAKEISDYIPKGLQFIPEDNPLWTMTPEGKIVTTQLKDKLLQPGETATVTVILKWINGDNNFGVKENIAEISKDYNDKGAKDIDSTPNNKIPEEDDQDNAFTVINPKTGSEAVYVILPLIVLTIISGGIIFIKKYVM